MGARGRRRGEGLVVFIVESPLLLFTLLSECGQTLKCKSGERQGGAKREDILAYLFKVEADDDQGE